MKRLLLLLLAGILFATPTITIAQSDEANARIDQAMADLSERLGITITRETHFWQWSERVFDDGSLGCPLPGQTYTQGQVVGYRVQITVGTTVYDYRLSPDGSLMVLCGEDGNPIDRTDQEVPASPTPIATATPQIQPVPEALWYAWVYLDGTDLLYLLTPEGPIASILRPAHPNEATPRDVRMVISPDGRYLVQAHALASGNDVLSIYDFATGTFQIVNVAVGETAHLGYSVNDPGGPAGYTHIFNYPSDRVVVGLSDIEAGTWRLVVIDLDTGTFLNQLSKADFAAKLPDDASEMLDSATIPTNIFVRPLYFDNEGRFHAQLLLANAGIGDIVPAFRWNIAANTVAESFYNKSSLDILPDDGTALYTYLDEDEGFLEPVGPFEPRNTIGTQQPEQDEPTPVYVNTDFFIFSPQWVDEGGYIVFETDNIEFSESRYLLFELGTQPISALLLPETYEQITGVVGGIIAYDQMRIVYHNTDVESSVVWDVPPRNGEAHIIWAQPPNREPQLAQLDLSELGNQAPADDGAPPPAAPTATLPVTPIPPPTSTGSVCPGTPANIISVGIRARVTTTDGSPTRLRDAPNGNVVLEMPEGTEFDVIGGPQCAGSYTWWQLELDDGTIGWAAEGDFDIYYIEPVAAGNG